MLKVKLMMMMMMMSILKETIIFKIKNVQDSVLPYPSCNADSIIMKILELWDILINSSIDAYAVQESKRLKNNKTLIIKGFATIHKDRKELNGYGLLLFICNNVTFEQLNSAKIQLI